MYCSTISSSLSLSRVSPFTFTVTPDERGCTPSATARVTSVVSGRIGWWKWKSCSPWRTIISASGGITLVEVAASAPKAGTTANTGGATSPDWWTSKGSLVAAA